MSKSDLKAPRCPSMRPSSEILSQMQRIADQLGDAQGQGNPTVAEQETLQCLQGLIGELAESLAGAMSPQGELGSQSMVPSVQNLHQDAAVFRAPFVSHLTPLMEALEVASRGFLHYFDVDPSSPRSIEEVVKSPEARRILLRVLRSDPRARAVALCDALGQKRLSVSRGDLTRGPQGRNVEVPGSAGGGEYRSSLQSVADQNVCEGGEIEHLLTHHGKTFGTIRMTYE